MKFLSFETEAGRSWGVCRGEGIVDLGARWSYALQDAVRRGELKSRAEEAENFDVDFHTNDVTFLPPLHGPEKIICIGVNYTNRNEEYRDDTDAPSYPSVFLRSVDSLTGHRQNLWRPPESLQLDYEGEIVIVIGKQGHRIAERDALDFVAGLTIMNEGSVRDWLRHAKFNVTQGKNFVRSGGIGPWLVPSLGQFGDFDGLTVTTRVNGEQRQHDTTANLMFSFRFLIHYLSTFFILKPGDMISTGTPTGAGARFDPPRYLTPGDTVEVEVPGVGLLVNGVEDDPTVE